MKQRLAREEAERAKAVEDAERRAKKKEALGEEPSPAYASIMLKLANGTKVQRGFSADDRWVDNRAKNSK